MKREILIILFLLFCFLVYSQTEAEKLIKGKWILESYSFEPSLSSRYNKPVRSEILKDSVMFLYITDEIFHVSGARLFNLYNNLKYSILLDSIKIGDEQYTKYLQLNLIPTGDNTKLRKKNLRSFASENYIQIVKLSNSMMTLQQTIFVKNSAFSTFMYVRYYFKKNPDVFSITEEDFQGEWFICENITKFDKDTLILNRDSCTNYNKEDRNEITIIFSRDYDEIDRMSFNRTQGTQVLSAIRFDHFNWILYPEIKLIVFIPENKSIVKYNYEFVDSKLQLIKQ